LLGCFLFSGDDVFKSVGVLSGGEKSRLALAKMLLLPANLLVLDEPTNHLDMRSKGVLQDALAEFGGSYVIVSHDRDFLDPIVNKVVEFRKGLIRTYPGNISDYLYAREKELAAGGVLSSAQARPAVQASERERKRLEAEQRQRRYARTRPVMEKVAGLERTIEAMENEKSLIEQEMADPEFYRDGERAKAAAARYRELQEQLPDKYFRWGKLNEELQHLRADEPSAGGRQ
jgi:ATP-binding cassette subfamily F protein 3